MVDTDDGRRMLDNAMGMAGELKSPSTLDEIMEKALQV